MPNYLKMPKKSQVLALLELGWSYRRIEAETGVRRETVSRYDRMRRANAAKTFAGSDVNPAKTFPGSTPRPRFSAAVYRTAIAEKLDAGLSLQRIWQDLVEEYGYGASYESVKHCDLSARIALSRLGSLGVAFRRFCVTSCSYFNELG